MHEYSFITRNFNAPAQRAGSAVEFWCVTMDVPTCRKYVRFALEGNFASVIFLQDMHMSILRNSVNTSFTYRTKGDGMHHDGTLRPFRVEQS
jgi:hypothetical protein